MHHGQFRKRIFLFLSLLCKRRFLEKSKQTFYSAGGLEVLPSKASLRGRGKIDFRGILPF